MVDRIVMDLSPKPGSSSNETRVIMGISWIFLGLGSLALVLFLFDPDIHAHPQLPLLAGTGLLGTLTLRALAKMMAPSSR